MSPSNLCGRSTMGRNPLIGRSWTLVCWQRPWVCYFIVLSGYPGHTSSIFIHNVVLPFASCILGSIEPLDPAVITG